MSYKNRKTFAFFATFCYFVTYVYISLVKLYNVFFSVYPHISNVIFCISGTSEESLFVTRQELLNIMRHSEAKSFDQQFNFMAEELKKRTNCDESKCIDFKRKLSIFKTEFRSRWAKACRINEKFQKMNRNWLDASLSFPRFIRHGNKRGRPPIPFDLCSARTKRLKATELRNSTCTSLLTHATCMSLRVKGQVQASKVLKDITSSPERASKYQNAYTTSVNSQIQLLSADDALAVLIDAKLSREQYDIIRKSAPEKFPAYKTVQAAKKLCYPKDITVTETSASVKLQALLDHTTERLCLTLESVIEHLQTEELNHLCLLSKWGFDGSSGHSSYKQAFYDLEASDSAVFITCLVPLRLTSGEAIVWQNPRPGSTRFCRPVKIEFIKESTNASIAEKTNMEEQIKNIHVSNVVIEQRQLKINHKLIFAMVDGKVCNALTGTTSTMRCFVCGATSKEFNKIDEMILKDIKTDNVAFGLSVLHGWIRMFECLLHLSYKLPLKKWQARGKEEKLIVAETKARIQKEFKDRCGLIIDKPKPGFGNTNDGNTARRFFQDPELAAEITGIDFDLIKKLHIIMIVVASGFDIDVEKYRQFAYDTARYFVSKYPWYNMPPTLHKYLIHGPEIISSALLPIGQLTEEAQEARNKDFKRYRENYSRKCSRDKTNADIFNFFLLSSDPVITSKQKKIH